MHILYIQVDNKIAFFFNLIQFEYILIGSVALLWRNAKSKCKFANKHTQANERRSK